MQVIGLCRFSYPALGGFQVEHESIDERIAYLFDPVRLEERFRFFETVTLPGLKAQTDPDFTFLVVIGDALPDAARARLGGLLADLPQAVLQAHPPGPHRQVMQAAINSVRRESHAPCLQFRLDDDDAVARDYVASLRDVAADCRSFLDRHRHVAIDFNQGQILRPAADGLHAAATLQPYWTAGLAIAFRPDVPLSVMNFGHAKVARKMPTITLTGRDMYVRGHNDFNDSRQKPGVKPVHLSPVDEKGEAHFRDRFAIDANHVRRVFGG